MVKCAITDQYVVFPYFHSPTPRTTCSTQIISVGGRHGVLIPDTQHQQQCEGLLDGYFSVSKALLSVALRNNLENENQGQEQRAPALRAQSPKDLPFV